MHQVCLVLDEHQGHGTGVEGEIFRKDNSNHIQPQMHALDQCAGTQRGCWLRGCAPRNLIHNGSPSIEAESQLVVKGDGSGLPPILKVSALFQLVL